MCVCTLRSFYANALSDGNYTTLSFNRGKRERCLICQRRWTVAMHRYRHDIFMVLSCAFLRLFVQPGLAPALGRGSTTPQPIGTPALLTIRPKAFAFPRPSTLPARGPATRSCAAQARLVADALRPLGGVLSWKGCTDHFSYTAVGTLHGVAVCPCGCAVTPQLFGVLPVQCDESTPTNGRS